MTAASYSYTFNTVLSAHLREILESQPHEQSYLRNAALSQMERTNKIRVDRGGYMHINVSFLEDAFGGEYDGATPVSTAGSDDVTVAQFRRALYAEPIKILHSEELDAGGERALFDLAAHKMKQAKKRLENKLAAHLWATSSVANGLQGLPIAISSTPGSGTWGGLDRAVYTDWQNQATTTFGSLGTNIAKLDTLSVDVTAAGADDWDWIVTDKVTFLLFKDEARSYLQINAGAPVSASGKRLAELGFSVVEFEGKPVVWDRNCPTGYLYFINNDAIKLAVLPGEEFAMTDFVPLHASGQQGRIAYLRWGGQIITYEPRLLGVATGIVA